MDGNGFSGRRRRGNIRRKPVTVLFLMICCFITLSVAGQSFFPPGVFHPDNAKLDSFVARWYSDQLTVLEEPSLFKAKQDSSVQSYRFLWLRTFHRPVSVRVLMHPDGSATLVTKVADGYKPGKLIVNKTESLPPDKVKNFMENLQRLKYWTLPERDTEGSGFDGAQWVVEGVDHGNYRLLDRWSPKNGPVHELGLYFLRNLSKLDLKDEPIY